MASGFDLDQFVSNPTLKSFESCHKADLILLAKHFGIVIDGGALKRQLKSVVLEGLVDKGVLGGSPTAELDGVRLPEGSSPPAPPKGDPTALDGVRLPEGSSPPAPLKGDPTALDGVRLPEGSSPPAPPKGDPTVFSPSPSGSLDGAKLKLRLARLDREREEKRDREVREAAVRAQTAEHEQKLAIRRLELEFQLETAVRLRRLELESAPPQPVPSTTVPAFVSPSATAPASTATVGTPASTTSTTLSGKSDLFKHIELPPFRESEVDAFFNTFERLATVLNWPKENWSTLLQCKLTGKAQHVIASLSLADSLNYDVCKTAVLRAYELVPEAYRQQFRKHRIGPTQTFVEFAREKGDLYDKWCVASKVNDFASMRELILLEEFKKCVPERCVMYLNEKKVSSLSEGAVLADEYVLTHKDVFVPPCDPISVSDVCPVDIASPGVSREQRECYYCHKKGHVKAECLILKRKTQLGPDPSQA